MKASSEPSMLRIIGAMALFVVVGAPITAYLWETLHGVLALRPDPLRLLVSAPLLALFVWLLWLAARHYSGADRAGVTPDDDRGGNR